MNQLEIIRMNGDLNRERWFFSLVVDYSGRSCIYLDAYSFETKESTRHRKWITQNMWNRLFPRNNTISEPPVSTEVEEEARRTFADRVKVLPIIK